MAVLKTLRAVPVLIGLLALALSARAAGQSAPEHEVKAAFLFNFTKFVTWPEGVPRGTDPFRICVVADGTATSAVERIMAGETVNGRATQTLVPASADQARGCHVLYVSRDSGERGATAMAAVRGMPVLTVGDGQGFLDRGGMIQFVLEEGRVRFHVHQRRATDSGLTISSRMLRVARDVRGLQ